MGDYQPRTKSVHRYFCRDCGVHVFGEGYYEVSFVPHAEPEIRRGVGDVANKYDVVRGPKVRLLFAQCEYDRSATARY